MFLFFMVQIFIVFLYLCRILVHHTDKYRNQLDFVQWHIPSKYPTEMAKKSQVSVKDGFINWI